MCHVITGVIDHSPIVKEFRIQRLDGGLLPEWLPGSHIALRFSSNMGGSVVRRYSLIGRPGTRETYRIAVQREVHGTGGSRALHEMMTVGTRLEVSGPFNGFPLKIKQTAPPVQALLIAGGIGITPMISMAHALNELNIPVIVHYLARGKDRFILLDELRALPHIELRLHDSQRSARADLAELVGDHQAGTILYACGPAGLLQAIAEAGSNRGWPRETMQFESFGARVERDDLPLTVQLALSEKTLEIAPGTSILSAMIAAEIFVSYDCQRGECGQCYARVLEGNVLHRDVCLTSEMRAAGMCPCVSWASAPGRIVLEI